MLLNGDRVVARNAESNLGNWICDAMRDYITTKTSISANHPGSPLVCLTNGGGIRASIPAGAVTQGQIITVSPFGNWCVALEELVRERHESEGNGTPCHVPYETDCRLYRLMVKRMNASVLMAALNSGLVGWTGDGTAAGRFPQVGGIRLAFDPKAADANKRLVNATITAGGLNIPLASFTGEIDVVTNNYVATGGDL